MDSSWNMNGGGEGVYSYDYSCSACKETRSSCRTWIKFNFLATALMVLFP